MGYFHKVSQHRAKYPKMVTRSTVHAVKVIRVKNVKDALVVTTVNQQLKVDTVSHASVPVTSIQTKMELAIRSRVIA